MQYTVKDVWGFSTVYAAMLSHPTDANHDYVLEFMSALNDAARSRGIVRLNQPSDALDLSHDLLLDEAAAAVHARWKVVGTTLVLVHNDLPDVVDFALFETPTTPSK